MSCPSPNAMERTAGKGAFMLQFLSKLVRGPWQSNPPCCIRRQYGRKSSEFHPLTIGCCTGSVVVTEGVGKNWN